MAGTEPGRGSAPGKEGQRGDGPLLPKAAVSASGRHAPKTQTMPSSAPHALPGKPGLANPGIAHNKQHPHARTRRRGQPGQLTATADKPATPATRPAHQPTPIQVNPLLAPPRIAHANARTSRSAATNGGTPRPRSPRSPTAADPAGGSASFGSSGTGSRPRPPATAVGRPGKRPAISATRRLAGAQNA